MNPSRPFRLLPGVRPVRPDRLALPAAVAFSLLALGACTTATGRHSAYAAPGVTSPSSSFAEAEDAMARGDYFYAARAYQQAAAADPQNASELRLRAAEAAAAGNDFVLADNLVAQLPPNSLKPDQDLRDRLVRARAALARNDAASAAALLTLNPPVTPFAERSLLVRARALFRLGDTVGGVQSLVVRERYLHDEHAIAENRDALWAGVSTAPLDPSTLSRAGSADPTTRGWIELENLARRNAPLEFYNTWRRRYPGHPGEERLASLFMPGVTPPETPAAPPPPVAATPGAELLVQDTPAPAPPMPGVAIPIPIQGATNTFVPAAAGGGTATLLLPATGPLANVSAAVFAGFSAAAGRAGAAAPTEVDIADGSVVDGYARASAAGTGIIVGPLRKDSVLALSQTPTRVPVLALNYLDGGQAGGTGFYQFGLAPEDEARAAAEDAFNRGLRRAISLNQASEWGSRVGAAFQQRFTELGGAVVASDTYGGAASTWSDPVKRLLRFHAIDDRNKIAELRAGGAGDPQRRNDFDFIFLGAHGAGNARLLWPMFRFFHADRIPVYSTAAVNEGAGDQDLAGIRFCDAPWLLDNTGTYDALREEAHTGRGRDAARLYVLGTDAFLLAQKIEQGGLRPGDTLAGGTGGLQVDAAGAIHRSLICARMTNGGGPVPLGSEGAQP